MNNFLQAGEVVTAPAPAGGVVSGQGVIIDALFGVAAYTQATEGADVELKLTGCFKLPKVAGSAFTFGQPLYWEGGTASGELTGAAPGNLLIGVAIAAAAADDAYGDVRLNGAFAIEPQT